MLLFQSFLVLFFSFLIQVQVNSLGWEIGLVLPCLAALGVFLSFERYLVLVLFSTFLIRWSPEILNLELWLWLILCLFMYLLEQVLPLRSWTSVLVSTLIFCGFWGWSFGSAWSVWEVAFYLAVSLSWSLLIFILFRVLLGQTTRPKTDLFFSK